jgi:hypothetical protein
VTLQVYTAQLASRDPDRFDITRKSGDVDGIVFAPSWAILRPALEARRAESDAATEVGRALAVQRNDDAWAVYVPAYLAEMRVSYRRHRAAWETLRARPRVVLVCYCVDPERCHRTLLAGILAKLGAEVRGELAVEQGAPHGLTGDSRRDGAIERHRAAFPR